jgi:hypothetical protein
MMSHNYFSRFRHVTPQLSYKGAFASFFSLDKNEEENSGDFHYSLKIIVLISTGYYRFSLSQITFQVTVDLPHFCVCVFGYQKILPLPASFQRISQNSSPKVLSRFIKKYIYDELQLRTKELCCSIANSRMNNHLKWMRSEGGGACSCGRLWWWRGLVGGGKIVVPGSFG